MSIFQLFRSARSLLFIDRKLCCGTVKSLFINGGKHGGEATVEAVQLIADHVKSHDCQLHPDSIEVRVINGYIFKCFSLLIFSNLSSFLRNEECCL